MRATAQLGPHSVLKIMPAAAKAGAPSMSAFELRAPPLPSGPALADGDVGVPAPAVAPGRASAAGRPPLHAACTTREHTLEARANATAAARKLRAVTRSVSAGRAPDCPSPTIASPPEAVLPAPDVPPVLTPRLGGRKTSSGSN